MTTQNNLITSPTISEFKSCHNSSSSDKENMSANKNLDSSAPLLDEDINPKSTIIDNRGENYLTSSVNKNVTITGQPRGRSSSGGILNQTPQYWYNFLIIFCSFTTIICTFT